MNKLYVAIIMLSSLTLISCQDKTYEEYFCEDLEIGSENSSTMYFQSSVRISNSEMCIFHRGKEFCTEFDKKADGYVDKYDWDKNLLHSELNISSRDGDKYIFEVFEKYEIRQDVNVEARSINNEWHFSFKGKDLKSPLSLKNATDESILIYKIAAIENQAYDSFRGDFVPRSKPSNLSINQLEKPSDDFASALEKFNEEILFFYGNEKYNDIKSYVNGTHLGSTYIFDKSNLTLTNTPTNPYKTDGRDGVYRYKCQAWKKQKWYNFP